MNQKYKFWCHFITWMYYNWLLEAPKLSETSKLFHNMIFVQLLYFFHQHFTLGCTKHGFNDLLDFILFYFWKWTFDNFFLNALKMSQSYPLGSWPRVGAKPKKKGLEQAKRHLNTLWKSKGNTQKTFEMNSHFESWECRIVQMFWDKSIRG
jgi:hypothetical protein